MSVKFTVEDKVLTAYIIGEIDHHTAKDIRESIDLEVESNLPELLILDFSQVAFMDSSGIGLVMGRYKLMLSVGGQVNVINMSDRIKKIMMLSGLDRLSVLK